MKFISVSLYEIVCLYLSLCFYKSAISSYQFDLRAYSWVVPNEVNTKKKEKEILEIPRFKNGKPFLSYY